MMTTQGRRWIAAWMAAITTTAAVVPAAAGANTNQATEEIVLESFRDVEHEWVQKNDPVMGGRSKGTFSQKDGIGLFQGEVVDVPFLRAPGFIKASTVDRAPFPDVSHCQGMSWRLRATSEEAASYEGYRVSFGTARPSNGGYYAYGYKADLGILPQEFTDLVIPFTDFTDLWDDATGDAVVTCQEDSRYCPTKEALKDLKTLSIWAEGVRGKVSVEIESIRAVECTLLQE